MKTVTTFNNNTIITSNEDVKVVFAPGVEAILHKEVISQIESIKNEGSSFMVAGGYFRDQLLNTAVSDVDIFMIKEDMFLPTTQVGNFIFDATLDVYGDMVRANSSRDGVFNLVVLFGGDNELKTKFESFTLDISKFGVVIKVSPEGEIVLVDVLSDGVQDLMSNTLTCGHSSVNEATIRYINKIRQRSVFQEWNIHFKSGDVMFYNDENLEIPDPVLTEGFIDEVKGISEFWFRETRYTAYATYGAKIAYSEGKRGTELVSYLHVFKMAERIKYKPRVWNQELVNHGWEITEGLTPEGVKLWGEKKYRLALAQHTIPEVQMLAMGWKGLNTIQVSWDCFIPRGYDLVGAKTKACEGLESSLEWYCTAFWSKYLGLAAKELSRYYKTHTSLLACGAVPNSHAVQVARSEQLMGALVGLNIVPEWKAGKSAKQCILAAIEKSYPDLDSEMLLETPSVAEAYQELEGLGEAATYAHKVVGKKTTETGWSLEVLPKDSPMNLFIGNLTECCQHLQGAARNICIKGWSDPHSINYVIKSPSGKVMAHFWTWVVPHA